MMIRRFFGAETLLKYVSTSCVGDWISAIVAAYGDPLLDTANAHERGFLDALTGPLCVDRFGKKKQSDDRRGDTSHAACDGSGAALVVIAREGSFSITVSSSLRGHPSG
jgi:hypothetical protein